MHLASQCSKKKGDHIKQEDSKGVVSVICLTDKCEVPIFFFQIGFILLQSVEDATEPAFVVYTFMLQVRAKAFQSFSNEEMYEEFSKQFQEHAETVSR